MKVSRVGSVLNDLKMLRMIQAHAILLHGFNQITILRTMNELFSTKLQGGYRISRGRGAVIEVCQAVHC